MKPFRYILSRRRLSLRESFGVLWRTWHWTRTLEEWEPIAPGDSRYVDAPYEAVIIWKRIPDKELAKHNP